MALKDLGKKDQLRPGAFEKKPREPIFGPKGTPVEDCEELQRVLELPRRPPIDMESLEAKLIMVRETARFARVRTAEDGPCKCKELDRHANCITQLLPIQGVTLREIRMAQGLWGSIAVGGGKCAAATVEFYDYLNGRRRTVAEIGPTQVATFNRTLSIGDATVFPSGSKPCVRFTIADGTSADFSTDHPVLTHRGWVHAAELVVGEDFVATATEMPDGGAVTVATDDEVKFVAYMLADGSCNHQSMGFTNMTPEVIEDWSASTRALGMGISEHASSSKARQFTVLEGRSCTTCKESGHSSKTCRSTPRQDLRGRWNLFGLAKNKRMHADLWGLPRRQVAIFLNRFWACDGHVQTSRGVELTLASEKLIDDVRFLCTRLGIRTRKQFKQASYLKDGVRHEFDAWRITASGSAALKFLDEVGDVLGKEEACRTLRASLEATVRNTNRDVVPIGTREVAEICAELRMPGRGQGATGQRTEVRKFLHATAGQFISRAKFVAFCRRWNYTGKYAHLATTDVAWERVTAVEDLGILPVYDLTVPGTHNFVANGVVVHNTIIGVLSMLAIGGCKMGLLLVPSNLMNQICDQIQILSQHFRVPKVVVHLRGGVTWKLESPTGETEILHVMSHDGISSNRQSDFIEQIKPDLIIIDEVDAFADLTSARTIRLNRYFREHGEGVKFVGMTGSPMDQRIEEIAHIMIYALKERAPIAIPTTTVQNWGRCLNAVPRPCPAGALMQLVGPEDEDEETETARVRSGFSRRLEDTLGVIMTSSADVQITGGDGSLVSIEVLERGPLKIPPRVKEALDMVRGGERPDTMFGNMHNEVFDDPKEQVRCAREVSCGMFYRWIFPRKEGRQVIDRWYKVRREYNSEQREQILMGQKWLDSPNLCETAARRHHGELPQDPTRPNWASKHWPEWREVKDTVVPETAVCRIDDFVLRDAAEWAHSVKGVVWYSNRELAAWMAEISGLAVYDGGPDGEKRIKQLINSKSEVSSMIASINSHGRGRDGLQLRYFEQLVLNVPSSSKRNQQLYARLHRRGQKSPVVRSHIYIHTDELRSAHMQALQRSDFVEQILKQRQKLKMGLR